MVRDYCAEVRVISSADQICTGEAFQQTHCAATLQHLILDSTEQTPLIWFISKASSAQEVAEHLSHTTPSTPMRTPELLSCPFPLYSHRQSVGDLLVLPPRWCVPRVASGMSLMQHHSYAQNLQHGEVSFVSWSRMSQSGLELAIRHELPVYRR